MIYFLLQNTSHQLNLHLHSSITRLLLLSCCPGYSGYHHYAKTMEMDRTCHATGARQHHPHSPSLDTRGET